MVSTPGLIAAESQRRRIPERWMVAFTEVTNGELAGMTRDEKLRPEVKAYAIWELEYREAAGIALEYDTETNAVRRSRSR